MRLGEIQTLTIRRKTDFGVYLGGEGAENSGPEARRLETGHGRDGRDLRGPGRDARGGRGRIKRRRARRANRPAMRGVCALRVNRRNCG